MGSTGDHVVQRIDRSSTDGIINALVRDGCCIIANFTDADTVNKVNKEVKPYLDADKQWEGELFPPETRRCTNLCGRSKTVRETWLLDPLIRALTAKFLDKTDTICYGDTRPTYTSEAQITIAITFDIGPNGKAQHLHRDDKNYRPIYRDQTATGYDIGSDVMMGFMIPGIRTTRENGATMAIPGSHLWGSNRGPKVEEAICAQMEDGECWVQLGTLFHGGGTNDTSDVRRIVHGLFFTRGYYRQEENIYLANRPEDVLSWSPEAQKLLGYHVSSPNIGYTQDFLTPIEFLGGGRKADKIRDLQ